MCPADVDGYCGIDEVCNFLDQHIASAVRSYGIDHEFTFDLEAYASGTSAESAAPSPKPRYLFRGQGRAHPTLQASLFREYPPSSTWHKYRERKVGADLLVMPDPHYSSGLEREFHFSCIKAAEIVATITNFPQINGHALCQHYGLSTHYLDFTEDPLIAAFFASHKYPGFEPIDEGVGVVYVLDTSKMPPNVFHEIGVQPFRRPFAQRGWLLQTFPGPNFADCPAVSSFYFQQRRTASTELRERFDGGRALVPEEELPSVFGQLSTRSVTSDAMRRYLSQYPEVRRREVEKSIRALFGARVKILDPEGHAGPDV